MDILTEEISPPSGHFHRLRSGYSPQYPVLKHSVLIHSVFKHPVHIHPVLRYSVFKHRVHIHPVLRHPVLKHYSNILYTDTCTHTSCTKTLCVQTSCTQTPVLRHTVLKHTVLKHSVFKHPVQGQPQSVFVSAMDFRPFWQEFRILSKSLPSDCRFSASYVTTASFLTPSSLLFTKYIAGRLVARTGDSDVK